jgi:hypothetical protein
MLAQADRGLFNRRWASGHLPTLVKSRTLTNQSEVPLAQVGPWLCREGIKDKGHAKGTVLGRYEEGPCESLVDANNIVTRNIPVQPELEDMG